jgi:RAB protein geranylgeranyltransferase component A
MHRHFVAPHYSWEGSVRAGVCVCVCERERERERELIRFASAQIILPQAQIGRQNDIYVFCVSSSHCVAPEGKYIAFVSTISNRRCFSVYCSVYYSVCSA